ncbi:Pik3c3, partial [Symbiodinium sp. CCMP2456]
LMASTKARTRATTRAARGARRTPMASRPRCWRTSSAAVQATVSSPTSSVLETVTSTILWSPRTANSSTLTSDLSW